MSKISIRGVLIGNVLDVVSSIVLTLPFYIIAIAQINLNHIPREQAAAAIAAIMHDSWSIRIGQMLVGLGCSGFAGYVAGRLAKHNELLNGTLSSLFCVLLGLYALWSGKEPHSIGVQLLLFLPSPVFGLFGGYLSTIRRRRVRS